LSRPIIRHISDWVDRIADAIDADLMGRLVAADFLWRTS